jgi:hypothetical protein
MVGLNAHDRAFLDARPAAVRAFAEVVALRPEQLRDRLAPIAAAGADRVVCGAFFPDWERDMQRYATALGL